VSLRGRFGQTRDWWETGEMEKEIGKGKRKEESNAETQSAQRFRRRTQ